MTNISNNIFTGIKWNKSSIKTVQTVVQALLNITEVFKAQNISFTLLKVKNEEGEGFEIGTSDMTKESQPDNVSDFDDGTVIEPPQEEQ